MFNKTRRMKKAVLILYLIQLIGCCKDEITPIITDYRNGVTGLFSKGYRRKYSCVKDSVYTGKFGIDSESITSIVVEKIDTNGLKFSTAIDTFRVHDIGNMYSSKLQKGIYNIDGNYSILYMFIYQDSICLRIGQDFTGKCDKPFLQYSATKK